VTTEVKLKHCIWCGKDVEKLTEVESTAGYVAEVCDSCLEEYDSWIAYIKVDGKWIKFEEAQE
jgi:hypothetical protein